jgi:hypothetical protein
MEKIGIKYGLFTALGLVVYFLLMKLLGLSHIVELRFLNALILTLGIVFAIKNFKKMKNGNIGYFQGLGTAFLTALVATTLFASFMLLYIKAFDDNLIEVLSANNLFGERMTATPGLVIFIVLMLEGMISGFMIGFIAMQYFKRRDHKVPGSP